MAPPNPPHHFRLTPRPHSTPPGRSAAPHEHQLSRVTTGNIKQLQLSCPRSRPLAIQQYHPSPGNNSSSTVQCVARRDNKHISTRTQAALVVAKAQGNRFTLSFVTYTQQLHHTWEEGTLNAKSPGTLHFYFTASRMYVHRNKTQHSSLTFRHTL